MAWVYWTWVLCNVFIGLSIVLFTYLIGGILLWRFDQTFYTMIAKLFSITRCIIDVNHKIVRKNSEIFTTSANAIKVDRVISRFGCNFEKVPDKNPVLSKDTTTLPIGDGFSGMCSSEMETVLNINKECEKVERTTIPNDAKILAVDSVQHHLGLNEWDQTETHVRNLVRKGDIIRCCWPRIVGGKETTVSSVRVELPATKTEEVLQNHPSHREYEREVLNVYGRFLTLNKKSNKCMIMTLAVIVISSVIIAGFQGCFLANITVYPYGLCPYYGLMECYHGSNFTYFQCTPNSTIDFPLFASSATCFRWIIRDRTISDVMIQIGACTGLFTAFGSVVEVLIRLLLFVFQQRPCVAAGIRRMMEKTVGINRITKPFRCCGYTLPFYFGILDLRLYQRPWLVITFFITYACLPAMAVVSIILLSYFRISITSLTYVILITVVMICCLGLLWVLWEEDEIGKIIPGGWVSISDMSDTLTKNFKTTTSLVHGVVPEKNLENLQNFTRGAVETLNIHTDALLGKVTSHIEQLTRRLESTLPISEVEKLTHLSQNTFSTTQTFKQLERGAQEVPTTQETRSLKDKEETIDL